MLYTKEEESAYSRISGATGPCAEHLIRNVRPKKRIEHELSRLKQERLQYADGTSLDFQYRYYTLSGKIDVLRTLSRVKKLRRDTVDTLSREIEENYREIRKIPKHRRDFYQTLQGAYLEAQLEIIHTWVLPMLFGA